MPLPVALAFAAAGAVVGGGIGAAAGGLFMWKRTNQAAALELSTADTNALAALDTAEIDLAQIKQQARELGVDISAVEAGYRTYRDGQIDLQAIAARCHERHVCSPNGYDSRSPEGARIGR
jgi:hypothetical protein